MKLKRSPLQWAAELLSLLAIVGEGVYLLVIWAGLPETLPSHFGADGTPDAFSGKPMLLIFWGIAVVLYLVFTTVGQLPRFWNLPETLTEKSKPAFFAITRSLLVSLKLTTTLGFGWVLITTVNSRSFGIVFVLLLAAAVLTTVSFYFIRLFRLSLADARAAIKEELE